MKKNTYTGKTKEELMGALAKETAVVRGYSSAFQKGTLKEYRASKKEVARIKTALRMVDSQSAK